MTFEIQDDPRCDASDAKHRPIIGTMLMAVMSQNSRLRRVFVIAQ